MKRASLLFLFVLSFACNPVKKMVTAGDAAEKAGRHEDATNYYYSALLKRPGHVDAMKGLQISAQPVLNDKFAQFSKYVVDNKIEEAVKQYRNAAKYNASAASVGVSLKWPSEYDEVYADVCDEYVLLLYDLALRLLQDKKFDAAEKQFRQIAEFDSTYKDATILRLNTVLDPLYQRGKRQLAKGQFKDAYNSFDRILEIDDHYLDASALRDESKEQATASLAVFPLINRTTETLGVEQLNEGISKGIAANNSNRYVRISVPSELDKGLESRGWGGVKEPKKVAEAARTFGYKYALVIELLVNDFKATPFSKEVRNAYEAFTENIYNPITGTYSGISKFRKTTYDDTYEASKLKYRLTYTFISASDGKVLSTSEIEEEASDEQHLLAFKGEVNNLYKELPQGNYLPPVNEAWRNQFTTVTRKLRTREQLADELSQRIGEQISRAVLPQLK